MPQDKKNDGLATLRVTAAINVYGIDEATLSSDDFRQDVCGRLRNELARALPATIDVTSVDETTGILRVSASVKAEKPRPSSESPTAWRTADAKLVEKLSKTAKGAKSALLPTLGSPIAFGVTLEEVPGAEANCDFGAHNKWRQLEAPFRDIPWLFKIYRPKALEADRVGFVCGREYLKILSTREKGGGDYDGKDCLEVCYEAEDCSWRKAYIPW